MTATSHLSEVDRAGARRIVRAWKMDQNTGRGEECHQTEHRDITGHANYFRRLKALTPSEQRRSNRQAIREVKKRDLILNRWVLAR